MPRPSPVEPGFIPKRVERLSRSAGTKHSVAGLTAEGLACHAPRPVVLKLPLAAPAEPGARTSVPSLSTRPCRPASFGSAAGQRHAGSAAVRTAGIRCPRPAPAWSCWRRARTATSPPSPRCCRAARPPTPCPPTRRRRRCLRLSRTPRARRSTRRSSSCCSRRPPTRTACPSPARRASRPATRPCSTPRRRASWYPALGTIRLDLVHAHPRWVDRELRGQRRAERCS